MTRLALAAALTTHFTQLALSQDVPRPLGNAIFVQPQAVARVAPDGRLTSAWHNVADAGVSQTVCNTLLCFDAFEPNGSVPGYPTECEIDCGMGSARWWFGTDYTLGTLSAKDMQMGCPDCFNQVAARVEFAWYWGPCPDHSGVSRCLIGLFTLEDWTDCPPGGSGSYGGTYSGILYDFGTLACNPDGYYFADVFDLCAAGLYHQLPTDGQGGYLLILAQGTSGGNIVLAEGGQPMLWGVKVADTQGSKQYQDDNPRDAMHNFLDAASGGECYDFNFGVCPNPLGTCAAFYSSVGRPPCTRDLCGSWLFEEDFESGADGWSMDGLWHLTSSGETCGAPVTTMAAFNRGDVDACDYGPFSSQIEQRLSAREYPISLGDTLQYQVDFDYRLTFDALGGDSCAVVIVDADMPTRTRTIVPSSRFVPDGKTRHIFARFRPWGISPAHLEFRFSCDAGPNDAIGLLVDNILLSECDPCDANCDGSINGFDVDPFVELLLGQGAPCSPCAGDINDDGSVNGFDVDGLVAGIDGPCSH